jgi:hypothetical protein
MIDPQPAPFSDKILWILLKHRKNLMISSIALVVAISGILYYWQSQRINEEDARHALQTMRDWGSSPQEEGFRTALDAALAKVPSLAHSRAPLLTQRAIQAGQPPIALSAVEKALIELRQAAPFHAAFAEASLLSERGEWQKSLELSVALKEKMAREGVIETEAMLYRHLLLKIAALQRRLGNGAGEKQALQELESAELSQWLPPRSQQLFDQYLEGKLR